MRPNAMLHSDAPIASPYFDAFGFQPLARQLAERINELLNKKETSDGGFVVGIEGAWGSGKSTLVELMKGELASLTSNPIIHFDPWWLSSGEDIKARILRELFSALPIKSNSATAKLAANLSARISAAPVSLDALLSLSPKTKTAAEVLQALREAAGDADRFFTRTMSPRMLRDRLAERMKTGGYRALVIVDDLDRLVPSDLRETLDALRTVADLPGVVYILCYDQENLDGLLRSAGMEGGSKYIEKIVNASIHMPIQSTFNLKHFLLSKLSPSMAESIRSANSYQFQATLELLDTPREAVRLANAFNFWSTDRTAELFVPDALLLEAVRVVLPDAPARIVNASYLLFGPGRISDMARSSDEKEKLKKELIDRHFGLEGHPRERQLRHAIASLFPQISKLIDPEGYYSIPTVDNPTHLRICKPNYFYTYFFHQPLPGMPPRAIIEAILYGKTREERLDGLKALGASPEGDIDPINAAFGQIDVELKAPAKPVNAEDLLAALIEAESFLHERLRRAGSTPFSGTWYIKNVIDQCVAQLRAPDATIKRLLKLNPGPYFLAWITVAFVSGTPLFPYTEAHQQITRRPVTLLCDLVAEFKKSFWRQSAVQKFSELPEAGRLLYLAERWGLGPKIQRKVRSYLRSREQTLDFFSIFMGYGDAWKNVAHYAGLTADDLKSVVERLFPEQSADKPAWPLSAYYQRW